MPWLSARGICLILVCIFEDFPSGWHPNSEVAAVVNGASRPRQTDPAARTNRRRERGISLLSEEARRDLLMPPGCQPNGGHGASFTSVPVKTSWEEKGYFGEDWFQLSGTYWVWIETSAYFQPWPAWKWQFPVNGLLKKTQPQQADGDGVSVVCIAANSPPPSFYVCKLKSDKVKVHIQRKLLERTVQIGKVPEMVFRNGFGLVMETSVCF